MVHFKVWCLKEGEPLKNAFEIEISPLDNGSGIRKVIRNELELKNIPASRLDLLRVNILIPLEQPSLDVVPTLDSASLEIIGPLARITPQEVSDNAVRIFVRVQGAVPPSAIVPSAIPRPQSPPIPGNDGTASSLFAPGSKYAKYLTEFVNGQHSLPTTEGGVSGLVRARMRDEPHTVLSTPTLLFFDLPECQEFDTSVKYRPCNVTEAILITHPDMRRLPLFGVSGCGKTRTAIELLSRTWGLYLNAGAGDHGSEDMSGLMRKVIIDKFQTQDKVKNTLGIRRMASSLLYARLWILSYCLSIPGCENTFTPQRWMLLQVATIEFLDVFNYLFNAIEVLTASTNPTADDIVLEIQLLYRKIQNQLLSRPVFSPLGQSKFLVMLDEAQELSRHRSGLAFLDSENVPRPLLAPIMHSIRRISQDSEVCVLPCGTGLGNDELTWSGGCASGIKLSACEFSMKVNNTEVVDFPGWVDEESISQYVQRLGNSLDQSSRNRLTELLPDPVIHRLFLDLRGRFRPIISAIEGIIEKDDPTQSESCIDELLERYTSADLDPKKEAPGNLCAELKSFLSRVESDSDSFPQYQRVSATLKFATAAYITCGGLLAYKGELPEVVEAAFGRIKKYNEERYTVIDEPFAFMAANNFFRKTDPGYFQLQRDILATCTNECTRGGYWETIVPINLVEMFHDKVVSLDLFNGSQPPHELFERKAEIIGRKNVMQTIRHGSMTMEEFLDAHFFHDSQFRDQRVPPFFFPEQNESGPDIVFVVRFMDADSDAPPIVCPVFVQLKLRNELGRSDAENARATVQPKSISNHKVSLSRYCAPHNQYISLIVSYPAEITKFFQREPLSMQHEEGITENALTVDNKNIRGLFSKEYVDMLDCVKRFGSEMEMERPPRKKPRVEPARTTPRVGLARKTRGVESARKTRSTRK
ncbi:MAG: hypothetical protein J3Q66DRAFT_434995 [Benniella sp.]|nr:MAG: hypothetical protein J3Q66DRAFT_434995 [Benniella sp.]